MSRASGLKAVAVVFTRLLNSPATRSDDPGAVVESLVFEHMDNPSGAKEVWYYAQGGAVSGPFSLSELLKRAKDGILNSETLVVQTGQEDWRPFGTLASFAKPTPLLPASTTDTPAGNEGKGDTASSHESTDRSASQLSENSFAKNKDALKGFGALLGLLIAGVLLWHYWRTLLYLSSFLGTWYAFASSSLKKKRSKILSVGGGFILGLLALMLTVTLFGGNKEPAQTPTLADAKEELTKVGQGSEQQPTATESLLHVLGLSRYGRLDIAELKNTLITADGSGYGYVVESTTTDYVFYHLAYPSQLNGLATQFAVIREPNQFYPEGSHFRGKRFRVVGMETFTTVAGAGKDLLVLRAVE